MSSNVGSLVLGVAGALVGGFFGGPMGAQAGWLIGSAVGGLLNPQQIEGPRLDDLKVQVSSYGAPIPIVYGSMRVAGNVIWATDLEEHGETESAKGGPEVTTYSYLANCAVLVCEGPVFGIRRIWANKRLVADYTENAAETLAPEMQAMAGTIGDGINTQATAGPRIYLGTETQTADPAIVADKGSSPAYRGWCYVVFEDYDTTLKDGSRLPQFEFEVTTADGGITASAPVMLDDVVEAAIDFWTVSTVGGLGGQTAIFLAGEYDDIYDAGAVYESLLDASQTECGFGYTMDVRVKESTSQYLPSGRLAAQGPAISDTVASVQMERQVCAPGGSTSYNFFQGFTMARHFTPAVHSSGDVFVSTAPGGGVIWAVDNNLGRINIYSGSSYALLESIVLTSATAFGNAFARPTHAEFVPATSTVWVSNGAGPTGSGTRFWVFSSTTFALVHRDDSGGANLQRMTYNAATGRMVGWTLAPTPNGRILDINDYSEVGSISAGFANTPSNSIYCDQSSPSLPQILVTCTDNIGYVFDAETESLIISVAGVGRFVCFDGARNAVYGTSGTNLTVFSLEGYSVSTLHTFGSTPEAVDYLAWADLIAVSEGSNLHLVDPETGSIERTLSGQPAEYKSFAQNGTTLIGSYDPASGAGAVYRIPLALSLGRSPVILEDIVSDISQRAGLSAPDLDYLALTDTVDGFVIGQQMPARSAIESLQPAYFFDIVESDDKLKAVKRGGAVAATIAADDRAAVEDIAAADALRITRALEQEIPEQVEVNYADFDGDYLPGTQYERRITRYSDGVHAQNLPLALTASKAKSVAIVGLYTTWLRQRFAWVTSLKYAHLEPTDVVTLPTPSATYSARIVSKKERAQGLIEWEAVAEDSALYSATGEPGASGYVPQTIVPLDATQIELMDIPLLRDEDDNAGFYAAASGVTGVNWPGTRVYKSNDAGATYAELFAILDPSTMGAASTALGDFFGGNTFDEMNTVTVRLTSGSLTSATAPQVLNGANVAVLGDEIIQFKTATLTATNTYQLSGLLRGRRGTERETGSHAIGDRFILGSETTWRRVSGATAEIGLERLYKAPTIGQRLSDVTAEAFTNTAVGLECYAPVQLGGGRNAALDVILTWVRRTRVGGEWRDNVDASLGETAESYEVEIWNAGFASLVRTITGLSSPTATYTAAQQVADFGIEQSVVYFKVFQLSATVGRGFEARGSV